MGTFTGTRDWIDAFRADPLRRLDRVLRHYDTISPYERGDAHDAADMALKERGTPEDRAAADRALAAWLSARIAEPPTVIADTGWNAYVTHLMEGFALAVRLRGPATGALLRDRYEEFDAWTHGLSDEGSGDVRARYLLALAHNQGATRRFLGVWYRLCDGAGRSDLDGFYRTVGLLGLRRLPAPDGAPPIAEVLEGLARWARHLPDTAEAREHFLLEWHAVSDGYPLTPESWRLLVAPIASAFAARPFVGWWREDVGITHEAGGIAPIHEPTIADTFELTRRLVVLNGEALDRAVTTFVGWQVRFAEVSRSTYTLERSLNVLGNALLRKDTPTAVGLALRLAVTALEHAPNHEPSWVLWAKALLRCGRPEAAESVLWRAIERFPDNAVVRTELAEMLEDRERAAEAEVLYRDTITRFPDDDVAPTALAKLLADTGRTQQAEALYRDTREIGRAHV